MISFIVTIKNRTKIQVEFQGKILTLELFKNNLTELKKFACEDGWEIVVVDFYSDDVNMKEFLNETLCSTNISYKHILAEGSFSRGKGLNIGVEHAKNDVLFFLDADMMIKTNKIFKDIKEKVVKDSMALFPVCWSYNEPGHLTGYRRSNGCGNAIYERKYFKPYMENKKWGLEDVKNYNYFRDIKKALRPWYGQDFIHQWHPNDFSFKNKFY